MKTTSTWVRDKNIKFKANPVNWWRVLSLILSSTLVFTLGHQIISNQAVFEALKVATTKCDYGRVVATQKGREIIFRCDEAPAAITDMYVDLINDERSKAGLEPLMVNQLLEQSAQYKACDMLNNNYFEHTNTDGKGISKWAVAAGYEYAEFGENIAHETGGAENTHQKFMESDTHRSIILDSDFTEVGVGKCGPYTVEHFGRPE